MTFSERETCTQRERSRKARYITRHTHNCKYTKREELSTCAAAEIQSRNQKKKATKVCCLNTTSLLCHSPLPLITGHHSTITYRLSSPLTLKGLRHIALSLVSGDVVRADDGQPRRRLNPETACQQWSDRIKTHCASSQAHVRTKRLQHYPRRATPWLRYRYAYESACDLILIYAILLFRYMSPSYLISLQATPLCVW